MRVTLLSRTFAKEMGYLENMLPKYLARAGVDMHVVAMDLPPYYWLPEFQQTYAHLAERYQPGTVERLDGYTLHIVGHRKIAGHMRMRGLAEKLAAIRPDIVQCSACIGWIPLDAALHKLKWGYRLFTGNHYHASVFPLAGKFAPWWDRERLHCTATRTLPGWWTSLFTEKCYAISPDCAEVAARFFGIPKEKIEICPLGVDTDIFHPAAIEKEQRARGELRAKLGFSEGDIVCIYTGRFSEDKNPLLLASAVAQLSAQGKPFRGLFVGNGTQAKAIEASPGCTVHPFVTVQELADFLRAADVAVWPTQESLSILDAAACALPVVANHTISTMERIEGNGRLYKLNDQNDLIRVLLSLSDRQTRQRLGALGSQKVGRQFSWEVIAKRRVEDYQAALQGKSRAGGKAVPGELYGRLN